MSIKLPLEILKFEGAVFYYLKDASGRTIAGGLYKEDAEEICAALNAKEFNLHEDKEHRKERLLI